MVLHATQLSTSEGWKFELVQQRENICRPGSATSSRRWPSSHGSLTAYRYATATKSIQEQLKLGGNTTTFKKSDPTKTNSRPVNVHLQFQTCLRDWRKSKLSISYIHKFLLSNLCNYHKWYNTQRALTLLIEKWRILLNSQGYIEAI